MIVYRPPMKWDVRAGAPTVFLAGSIDMGAATDWQTELAAVLAARDVTILNPRRQDWDSTWRQSIDEPKFREQVEWELDGLDRADVVAMWFAPESKAPITLLELGLTARSGKLLVGCTNRDDIGDAGRSGQRVRVAAIDHHRADRRRRHPASRVDDRRRRREVSREHGSRSGRHVGHDERDVAANRLEPGLAAGESKSDGNFHG